jgi:mRNA interferase HigB
MAGICVRNGGRDNAALDKEFPVWEPKAARVIGRRAIRAFAERYPDALEPLLHWASATETVDWRTPGEVRRTFNSADFVGDPTVFDVGGNKYRVAAFVHYRQALPISSMS